MSPEDVMREQVSFCGHLLIIDKNHACLIHESAKGYLLREDPDPDSRLEFYRINEEDADSEIARIWFDYLHNGSLARGAVRLGGSENSTRLRDFPFLSYSILHWPEHAARSSVIAQESIFNLSHLLPG
jgi:hypothetical protein